MKKLFLTVATAAMMFACTNNADKNPFLTEWNTPQGVPPFEQIKAEHYLPAFEEGIKQQQAEIEAIINNPEAPTFENTLEAMDKSGRLLSKVALVFFNITESDGSEELTKVQEVVLPLVSAHSDNIYMDARLFERVKAVYEGRE
ncbi:MAG: peptidase M3, partial [Paludibacteraceae bacterium]|nr:peptidase M3 [Paludibacteraceae bacterium]